MRKYFLLALSFLLFSAALCRAEEYDLKSQLSDLSHQSKASSNTVAPADKDASLSTPPVEYKNTPFLSLSRTGGLLLAEHYEKPPQPLYISLSGDVFFQAKSPALGLSVFVEW